MKINGITIGENAPPYIIAEISANHNGEIEKAKRTIEAAAQAGANAVKLQTYTPQTMTIKSSKEDFQIKEGLWKGYSLFDLYARAHTPFEWHSELFSFAKQVGITLFSTPFDESAVELLETLKVPAYKVASFEITDLPLIHCIAKTRKPILMSTGMASVDEIGEALEVAKLAGCKDILIFHCISSYPAPIEQANLRAIKTLSNRFKVEVGLSDHTIGNTVALASVAMGAVAIEKHFTLDRNDKGPDSEFSIEPDELAALVMETKNAWRALGNGVVVRAESEKQNLVFRRSLYFIKDLKAGQIVTASDIRRIRPGFGLPPKFENQVIGSRLTKDITAGDRVSFDVISTLDKQT